MAGEIQEIGNRLRWLREAKDLSQTAFCRVVKIEQQAWNNYEHGRKRISIDQALKVCVATGATLDYIYRGIMSSLPLDLGLAVQAQMQQQPAAKRRP